MIRSNSFEEREKKRKIDAIRLLSNPVNEELYEIEMLQDKIFHQNDNDGDDRQRLNDLKSQISNVPLMKIQTLNGTELIFERSPIYTLRIKIARYLQTWSPCVILHSTDGSVIEDDDTIWYSEIDGTITLLVVNDINEKPIGLEKMVQENQWIKLVHAHIKYQNYAIFDLLERISPEDSIPIKTYTLDEMVREGETLPFKKLLNVGPQLDAHTLRNTFLLAVMCGKEKIISTLLVAKVDPNKEDSNGALSVVVASACGRKNILSLLLEASANPNLKEARGDRALVAASRNGHEKIVSLLLNAQVGVNASGSFGNIPLVSASRYGHEQIVSQLLAARANINMQEGDGDQALLAACREGKEQIVSLLLASNATPHAKGENGDRPIVIASRKGYEKIISYLLRAGEYIDYSKDYFHEIRLATEEAILHDRKKIITILEAVSDKRLKQFSSSDDATEKVSEES